MEQRLACEWYDETIKKKTAARWRQCDVLGCINWQRGCWAFPCTRWPENECAVVYKILQDNFIPWYRKQRPVSFKKKIIFMQDNAPSHAARYTIAFLEKLGFKDEKLMIWPPASPDRNPTENYWSILKRHTYSGGKQYNSKDDYGMVYM